MQFDKRVFLVFFVFFFSAHGQDKSEDVKDLRKLINQVTVKPPTREKSTEMLTEVNSLKETLLKSSQPVTLSKTLNELLKTPSDSKSAQILGSEAVEAIADPNINIIDSHIPEIVSRSDTSESDQNFQPDLEDIRKITKEKHGDATFNNLYRENLHILSIKEEHEFKLGQGVVEWKVLTLTNKTALIGRTGDEILVMMGHNDTYEQVTSLKFNITSESRLDFEVVKIWDSYKNRVRSFVLVAVKSEIVWYELIESELLEVARWNLLKEITAMTHFDHDGSEIILVKTVDDAGKVQAEFIEFNVPDSEFWVIQAFTLQENSPSMTCLDLGRDLIVAFAQKDRVVVYRHQQTKHLRGKFTLFKTIEAANVSSVSGFRIGGHSYLAIGGDQPQILRYFNDDFHQQTILSQSFGFVEEFLPITVRTYRDDLILLVQHRLELGTHTVAVVDALVWNGIAFENALSVPCQIAADPNANGFTCMLDLERDEGLLGAASVHHEKENGLFIVVPRKGEHSGMFKVNYEIVNAEDPLIKEIEQVKKSIELINQMLDFEELVKKEVDEAMRKAVNPKNDFDFENLQWIDEIDTEFLRLDGQVTIESDVIEFMDSNWTQADLLDIDKNLDLLEASISADEQKLKTLDEDLNKLNRNNRQTKFSKPPRVQPDSPVYNIGTFQFNGQLDTKTIRVENPQSHSRQKRQLEPIEESTVLTLNAKNIDVETINGIPVSDFVFLENGILFVPNTDIIFNDSIVAEDISLLNDGRLNGVDFSEDVLAVDSPNPPKNLIFDEVTAQSLEVGKLNNIAVDLESLQKVDVPLFSDTTPVLSAKNVFMDSNLKVETINGIKWNEFVANLVPKHKPSTVESIVVEGDVVIVGEGSQLNIAGLNGLPFPEGYVLKSGRTETQITGKKTFDGELITQAIDTDGTINNIAPIDVITLDQPQSIPAEITFKVLEVTKKLEVNGTIAGRKLDEFLPNPTLQQTKEVLASCSFRDLIVQGTVTIENSLNDQKLESVLADVIYETDDEVVINAPKIFKNLEVAGDVKIESKFINDVNLENIMMTDREQTASFERLQGDVFASNMKISGLFDGINATELERNSVRMFGDQFIETPLIITKGHRIESNFVDIKDSINGISVKDFLFIDQPINIETNVDFSELEVESLKISGDVSGPGKFVNVDFNDLSTNYLSKTRVQKILAPARIKNLVTNGTFHADTINGFDFEKFKKFMRGIRDFKSLVLTGEQKLDTLVVNGNVKVKTINDRDFQNIIENVIWLNRPNTISGNLVFLDDVVVDGALTVQGTLNRKSFKAWVDNWISNQQSSVVLKSDKTFLRDVVVSESLTTESINNIKVEDLLMVDDVMKLETLNVHGSMNVANLTVTEGFNHRLVQEFLDLYSFDAASNTHVVNADVVFIQSTNINYLNTPKLNQIIVKDWMENLIKINENNVEITSEKIFANQFVAQDGFLCKTFNNEPLSFLDFVVLINEQGMVDVKSDLVFGDDVYAGFIGLTEDLHTRFVSNCDIMEWLRWSLPINRPLNINGVLNIHANAFNPPANFTANFINGISFADIITLHTNQSFGYGLNVTGSTKINEPVTVSGLVNRLNIQAEREDTVMRYGDQVITTKTSFPGARVLGALTAFGKVNSKNLSDAVFLGSPATIDSAMNFHSLEGNSLTSDYPISNLNFNLWYENLLWKTGKGKQIVTGEWKVKQATFTDDVTGNGLVNGKSISEIENNLKNNIGKIGSAISDHKSRFYYMCKELEGKANESQNAIHVLKYFEMDFVIQEPEEIFSFFTFKKDSNFLAINTNCTTKLYKWETNAEKFSRVSQVETGVVYDWEMVKNVQNDMFIVTNSRMEVNYPCRYGGLNVWKVSGDQMIHITTISNETDVLQLHSIPELPGMFFTLNNLDVVTQYDLFGEKKEIWKLPVENANYSFIPADVRRDLHLFNGKKLYNLISKFKNRYPRSFPWDKNTLVMKHVSSEYPPNESPIHTYKKPNPADIQKLMLPSIPAIPLGGGEKQDKKPDDFMMNLKKVGDAMRRSLSDSWNKLPKLTIKNSRVNDQVKNNLEVPVEVEGEKEKTTKTGQKTYIAIKKKPFVDKTKEEEVLGETFVDRLKKVGKALEKSFGKGLAEAGGHSVILKSTNLFKPLEENDTTESSVNLPESSNDSTTEMIRDKIEVEAQNEKVDESTKPSVSTVGVTQASTLPSMTPTVQGKIPSSTVSPGSSTLKSDELEMKKEKATNEVTMKVEQLPDDAQESTSTEKGGARTSTAENLVEKKNLDSTTMKTPDVELSGVSGDLSRHPVITSSTQKSLVSSTTSPILVTSATISPHKIDESGIKAQQTTETTTPSNLKESINSETEKTTEKPETSTNKIPPIVFQKLPEIPVAPKIIFPLESEDFTDEVSSITTKFPEVVDAVDLNQQVPIEVLTGSGVSESENTHLPERGSGEFLMIYVGPRYQKRVLYAVARSRGSTVQGNHNIIEIYFDIFEGRIYQYIQCRHPSNLVALHFKDETLLAFLESHNEIHIYIYRGVQGFVGFKRIKLPGYALQMTSLVLPPKLDYKCDHHYLVVRIESEILFYNMKIAGNCGVKKVQCDH